LRLIKTDIQPFVGRRPFTGAVSPFFIRPEKHAGKKDKILKFIPVKLIAKNQVFGKGCEGPNHRLGHFPKITAL